MLIPAFRSILGAQDQGTTVNSSFDVFLEIIGFLLSKASDYPFNDEE